MKARPLAPASYIVVAKDKLLKEIKSATSVSTRMVSK